MARLTTGRLPSRSIRVLPAEWKELTKGIIGAAIEVHTVLGPGILERMYEDAMVIELKSAGLAVQRQRPVRMQYKGHTIGNLKMDLIVEGLVVVELKAIETVLEVHKAQLLTYLRAANIPLGLLMNFNCPTLKEGITRRFNERASVVQSLPFQRATSAPA